jgi:effector-binding domain-containing protein
MTTQTTAPPEAVSIIDRQPEQALVLRIEGPVGEMPRMMGEAFGRTIAGIQSAGATVSGMPFARYHGFGPIVTADVGFPFTGTLTPPPGLEICELPGGRAVTTTHVGPYDQIGLAWERAQAFVKEHELTTSGPPWECYLTGPDEPGPPVTQVVFPVD